MCLHNDNNVVGIKLKRIETSVCSIIYKAFYIDFWAAEHPAQFHFYCNTSDNFFLMIFNYFCPQSVVRVSVWFMEVINSTTHTIKSNTKANYGANTWQC